MKVNKLIESYLPDPCDLSNSNLSDRVEIPSIYNNENLIKHTIESMELTESEEDYQSVIDELKDIKNEILSDIVEIQEFNKFWSTRYSCYIKLLNEQLSIIDEAIKEN